jgi:hypothetical protein
MRFALIVALLAGCAHLGAPSSPPRLRVRVRVAAGASQTPVSGRLLVMMGLPSYKGPLRPGFFPGPVWVAAQEVAHLEPGGAAVEFDPDAIAYPHPFSSVPAGHYRFAALLDVDHDYGYGGADEDDLMGPVAAVDLDADKSHVVELVLDHRGQKQFPSEKVEGVERVDMESPLLSAFWGRPIVMHAAVVLPPGYDKKPDARWPTVFDIHGYSGDHTMAFFRAPEMRAQMASGKRPELIYVFLDGRFPTGHHEFADSANNGPWGRALVEEFIPFLERRFRMVAEPRARFLTGHSSGGWSSLWLQITHPETFGGTWSTSPDPVDFRSFTGIDATPGSKDNAFRHNLIRMHGKNVTTFEEFARQEIVLGEYGGQLASFEWVFSPKGDDGRPMQMFDRATGELDQSVLRAWEKYDIRKVLAAHWDELSPKLRGRIHLIVGGEDNFHLEEAVHMLCDFLREKGSDATCEFVPGRDHMDLYQATKASPDGLDLRIAKEMQAAYEAARRPATN